jgi:hypothetical protein
MLAMADDRTRLMLYRSLWHIDAATCTVPFGRLVADRFLVPTRSGADKRSEQV